jgi:hypothetical protein
MAKLSKDDFQKLWDEFQDDPAEVGGNPNNCKSLVESARGLLDKGDISEELAKEVMATAYDALAKLSPK